jgi:NAD(P)-dependent dehydrogenase (short-subunit alcohol dehydrogenase family)
MSSSEQKIAVVTGANTGLGFETSLGLARQGYTVVLACRSEEKANSAMLRIRRQVPNANLDFIAVDLVDRESVRQFADSYSQRYDHLNALINNAGVMGPPYTITQNNLELQFDANHVGHFYLTSLLIDKLDQPYETRIVNVSSLAGKRDHADIHFDNLNFEGNYEEGPKMFGLSGMVAYSQSKLANILFTMELKDRLQAAGKNVKAVVVHPGVSRTDLARNMSPLLKLSTPLLARFMDISKPSEGAESSLYGALSADVSAGDFIGPTGKEERKGPPGKVPLPPKASDKALCERLWSTSEELLGISFTL